MLAVAVAFQQAAGHNLKRPPLERYLAEEPEREKKEKEAKEKEARDKEAKEKEKPKG